MSTVARPEPHDDGFAGQLGRGLARTVRWLRAHRPGLRAQIALGVWLAVLASGLGMQRTALSAMVDSLGREDQTAHAAAMSDVRADWASNPKATAQQFGLLHSSRTWTFAVWQVKLSELEQTREPGAKQPLYSIDVAREPDWAGTGGWPTPMGTTYPWDKAEDVQVAEYLAEPNSFAAVLPRGDGTALVVAERYRGADWDSFQSVKAALRQQGWVTSIVAALGAWLLSGVLMRPARRAAAVARRLGRGELDARVPATGHDEVGQLGVALNEMAGDLQRMVAAQRHFISDTAHELRTPTAALLASASALENPATRDEAATMVAPQLRRLSGLTEDLLSLSRFDDQREHRDDQVVDLVDLATRAAAQVSGGADVRVDADGPVFAIVDPARVATIVRNLVANGLRHGEAPVRVVVSQRAGRALVRVDDAGPGVAEELRATIFDRFVRGDQARHGEGAGLGLAIARENAELHGGSLRVNDDGHGFVLELPTEGAAVPAVREQATAPAPRSSSRRVVDELVGGLFSTAMVFLVVMPPVMGLRVTNDYGRLGLAVVLGVLTVLATTGARWAARVAGVDRPRRWLAELAALMACLVVADWQYRALVAAGLGLGWAGWRLADAWSRRRS